MKGEAGLHFWLQLDDWNDLVETDDLDYTCEWKIDFIMGSVKDGGLEIRVQRSKPDFYEAPGNKFELGKYGKGSLKPCPDWAKRYFAQSLSNLSSLESSLTNAFKSQKKNFFPGSGA